MSVPKEVCKLGSNCKKSMEARVGIE